MDPMANTDRLTGLDASFLALEKDGAHMHVGSVLVFEGPAPAYDDVRRAHRARAAPRPALPPAARVPAAGRLAPGVGRRPALQRRLPRAPHRAAAPAGEDELRRLAGRVFSQQLDREKPLWEIWLVDERRPTTASR